MNIIYKLEEIVEIERKNHDLPKNSIYIYKNTTKNNELIGYTISLYEPSYPELPDEKRKKSKNVLSLKSLTKEGREIIEFRMPIEQEQALADERPSDAELVKVPASELATGFTRIRMLSSSPNIFDYIVKHIEYCIANYESKCQKFGCCSKYIECSDVKHCVHINKLYSTACYYRKNLEQNRIFYGKNKNN